MGQSLRGGGGLTLICGENNTGKTHAVYSLYGYLDFIGTIRKKFLRIRKNLTDEDNAWALEQNKQEIKLTYQQIQEQLEKHIQKTKLYSANMLSGVMAGKDEYFLNGEFSVEYDITLANIKNAIEKYLTNMDSDDEYKIKICPTIYNDGLGFSGSDRRMLNDSFFDSIIHIIFINIFILSVERTGASIFQEELDFIKIAKLETMQKILNDEKVSVFSKLNEKSNFILSP